jgi:hypothetical protein
MCPNCGELTDFLVASVDCVDRHGLDCGPYERWTEEWWVCRTCGKRTTQGEVDDMEDCLLDFLSLVELEPTEPSSPTSPRLS